MGYDKANGQPRRKLDTTGAEREFGFKATTTFEEGLQRTVEWYESTSGSTSKPARVTLV